MRFTQNDLTHGLLKAVMSPYIDTENPTIITLILPQK